MDIETLKDALGDEKFAALQTYVTDLVGQRDAARSESITGRKGLRTELDTMRAAQAKLMEKLGVDSLDDIDALPDAKGAAEAAKQYGAQIKRLERQLTEATQREQEATGKYRSSLQRAAVAEAMGGHEFVARDIVETYVGNRLTWEGDDLLFKDDSGRLLPIKDGVAGIAKTRPELLKASGTGGSGARTQGAGGAGGARTMPRSEFESLPPAQRLEHAKAGITLT
jgi:hypothetical protein